MVPPASHKLTGVRGTQDASRITQMVSQPGSHRLWPGVPACERASMCDRAAGPTTPSHPQMAWFGLLPVRSPLLGESRLIFSRQATEMFQFAHLPPACLWVQQAVSRHHSGGVAPFGLSGLMACMQLPRNVSPVSASFIGLQRQGIHPVLCRACRLDSLSLLT